jgi:hypothetical protein
MNDKHVRMIIVAGAGCALVVARRWKNKDEEAGMIIAFLTILEIIFLSEAP